MTGSICRRKNRLGLRQSLLQGERPTGGSRLVGSITQGLPRTIMRPLVVVTGRQGERRGLGLEQRLRLAKSRTAGCHASRAAASVATSASPTAMAARLPSCRSRVTLLAEPDRRFVEVAGGAGDQTQIAQRIDRIGWRPGAIEVLDGVAQQAAGPRIVPLHPGDQAEVKAARGRASFHLRRRAERPRWPRRAPRPRRTAPGSLGRRRADCARSCSQRRRRSAPTTSKLAVNSSAARSVSPHTLASSPLAVSAQARGRGAACIWRASRAPGSASAALR